MKILSVNKYYQHTGGGDRFFFDSMRILSEQGHEVFPFCLDYFGNLDTDYQQYFIKGVRGSEINNSSFVSKIYLFMNGIYSFNARAALRRIVEDIRPNVAHLHILHYSMSPSIIDELYALHIPIVFSLHDYRIFCAGAFLYSKGGVCMKCKGGKFFNAVKYKCYRGGYLPSLMGTAGNYLYSFTGLYEKVSAFTVPHEDMLELMVEWGIPRSKLHILKNPIISPREQSFNSLGDYVLYFGTLTEQKGIFTLLKAAENMPDIKFLFCGNGDALGFLKNYIFQNGLNNITIDTTTRSGGGLEELIASAYCVVSPSEWLTPLEYSTLEAMLQGKVVVASNIGGNKFVIESWVNGVLFEPGDYVDLEKVLRKIYTNPKICQAMGNAASETVKEKFTEATFSGELAKIFNHVIY